MADLDFTCRRWKVPHAIHTAAGQYDETRVGETPVSSPTTRTTS